MLRSTGQVKDGAEAFRLHTNADAIVRGEARWQISFTYVALHKGTQQRE